MTKHIDNTDFEKQIDEIGQKTQTKFLEILYENETDDDFISMYHTFEHFMEPNKKLELYVSLLKDDGVMLISTPEWLNLLDE